MSEISRLRGSEGYGACGDDGKYPAGGWTRQRYFEGHIKTQGDGGCGLPRQSEDWLAMTRKLESCCGRGAEGGAPYGEE